MAPPVIVELALNGATSRVRNRHVPRTPEEITEVALEGIALGASIVHNHNDEPMFTLDAVHAAEPAAGQLLDVRPPPLHRDPAGARAHRRVEQHVGVAREHRLPRGDVGLRVVHGVEREHRLVVVVVHDRRAQVDAVQSDLGDLLGRAGHVAVARTRCRPVQRQLDDHR